MLKLREALTLYSILYEYIPEEIPDDLLSFTGKILENINNSDHPESFGEALLLVSGKSIQDLDKLDTWDRIDLFVDGLQENKFLTLVDFCKTIGL